MDPQFEFVCEINFSLIISVFLKVALMFIYCVDAYVGAWITVQEGGGIAERDKSGIVSAEAALLLLCGGLQEQHRPSEIEAVEGFSDTADTLQAKARSEAIWMPEMWEAICSARRLEDSREELWEAVVLHLWV